MYMTKRPEEREKNIPLVLLASGQVAEIVSLPLGQCGRRLEALGLRPGKKIKKLHGMPFCGPVALDIDGRQVAIGYGAASSIIVKPVGNDLSE
jgi:ferrous iron transport protein A